MTQYWARHGYDIYNITSLQDHWFWFLLREALTLVFEPFSIELSYSWVCHSSTKLTKFNNTFWIKCARILVIISTWENHYVELFNWLPKILRRGKRPFFKGSFLGTCDRKVLKNVAIFPSLVFHFSEKDSWHPAPCCIYYLYDRVMLNIFLYFLKTIFTI